MLFLFRTEVCCGVIYIGLNQDVLIEGHNFHPCDRCTMKSREPQPAARVGIKRLDSESSTESGVVCPEDEELKFPTPPITQPSSPLSENSLLPAECSNVKFSATDLVLDLTSSTKTMEQHHVDDLLYADEDADDLDDEEDDEEAEIGEDEESVSLDAPLQHAGLNCIA
jgi:hypothetical protein